MFFYVDTWGLGVLQSAIVTNVAFHFSSGKISGHTRESKLAQVEYLFQLQHGSTTRIVVRTDDRASS
jgi:hypothetical protein